MHRQGRRRHRASQTMGSEIVHHQDNLFGLGILFLGEVIDAFRPFALGVLCVGS
jgi:hypothetical protein